MDKNIIEAEFLVCVGLCVNDWNYKNKEILISNTNNIEIIKFLSSLENSALNKVFIHYISKDSNLNLPNVKLHSKKIDLSLNKFDLIIDLDIKSMEYYSDLLKDSGILITSLSHLKNDLDSAKRDIENANFKIKMPFIVEDKYYLFLSNKFHPLSDFCLQKLDMIENLEYYNAKMHEAAFALPNYLKFSLQNIIKN